MYMPFWFLLLILILILVSLALVLFPFNTDDIQCPVTDDEIRADLILMRDKFTPMFDVPVPYRTDMTYGQMFYLEDTGDSFDAILERVLGTQNNGDTKGIISDEIYARHLPIIMELKELHGKPRPKYSCERLGITFPIHDVPSAQSPAFPSGHAFFGMMFGAILYRDYYKSLRDSAGRVEEDIAQQCFDVGVRRIVGGVHYPSDVRGAFLVVKRITRDWKIERLIELYESKIISLSTV